MSRRHWVLLIIASLGWGAGGVFTRAAFDQGLEPVEFSVYRPAIGAVATAVWMLGRRMPFPRDRAIWRAGLVVGTANLAGPFLLFTLAVVYASAGFVGLLVANIPLATAVWAHLLGDDPLDAGKLGGLALSSVGILLLLVTGDAGLGDGGNAAAAIGLSIGGLVLASFGIIYAKRVLVGMAPTALSLPQFVVGALTLALLLPFTDGMPNGVTPAGWALVAAAGIGSTALPFILFYEAMQEVTALQASLTGYLIPIFAVLLGAAFLAEQVTLVILGAGVLILAGVLVTDRATARGAPRDPRAVPNE